MTLPRGVRARRPGRSHGRATPGEARDRADARSTTSTPSSGSSWRASARRGRRTPTAASSRRTAWRTTSSPGSTARSSAYGGMWLMVDEAHITTFAVHPAWRRQRIGERLLLAFLDLAVGPPRPRGDARGPPVERRGPPAVREVRLPAGRAPAALLQRRRRGRADHDDRAARRAAVPRSGSTRLRAALDASPAPTPARTTRRRGRRRARQPPPEPPPDQPS